MKLQYLGTAAAEGIPALFCNCEVCENARLKRGKEIKTRSQALVDDTLLIDFPADTYMHALQHGVPLPAIHTLLITHSHSDHLYPPDFWCRNHGIGNCIEEKPLDVFATAAACKKIRDFNEIDPTRVTVHEIRPFEPFEAEGYRIIPLAADHDPTTDPVFYIIEKDEKALLYAHDTGWFPEETRQYLAAYKGKLDCLSLDCTGMLLENYRVGHMALDACRDTYHYLTELGLCDEKTVVCLNHFSHNGKATHEQLTAIAEKDGFSVAYDGMTLCF